MLFRSVISMGLKLNDYYIQDKELEICLQNVNGNKIVCDQEKLVLVFSNLINNAAKYSDRGQKIVIGYKKHLKRHEFFVQDFGQGFEISDHENIFEVKKHKISKGNNYFSLGLGLNISKYVIDSHRGKLEIDSKPNKGTIIKIEIPEL